VGISDAPRNGLVDEQRKDLHGWIISNAMLNGFMVSSIGRLGRRNIRLRSSRAIHV
jgi:hypothetical protein